MRPRTHLSGYALVLAAMLAVAGASPAAGETVAPPGNSGVDQYFEVVPTAKGNAKPTGERGGLPRSTRRRLKELGASGRKLERLVDSTAPARQAPPRRRKPSQDRRTADAPPVAPLPRGDSPLTSATGALTGSSGDGMGVALPVLLVGAVVVIGVVARRRRRYDSP